MSARLRMPSLPVRILLGAGLAVLAIGGLGVATLQPSCTRFPATQRQIPVDRLRGHVAMLSETLAPRSHKHVANLDRCAAYVAGQFKQAGARVELQPFGVDGKTYQNVAAVFGPESPSRIVVGAHYDAFRDTPGADDNASGVAGLIELAHLLGSTELKQRVELVAFTLEEPPYFRSGNMGSARHAYALRQNNVDVEAMLCLEMIGFFSDEKGSQRFPSLLLRLFYPDRGNYIAVIGSTGDRPLIKLVKDSMRGATDLPVHSMCATKSFPGIDFSDHLNYWHHGYTAAMITDTAFMRNLAYHGSGDTLQRLDFDRMAKVVLGVYEAVVRLAGTDAL